MFQNDSIYNTVYADSDTSSEKNYMPYEHSNNENAHVDKNHWESEHSEEEHAPDIENALEIGEELCGVFDQYETWLRLADGGRKNSRSALQCRRQVEIIISYIASFKPNLQCILDKKIVRDEWLVKFENRKQPGTVKSCLGTLSNFYTFLKCENVDVGVPADQLSGLTQQAKLRTRSFRKKRMD